MSLLRTIVRRSFYTAAALSTLLLLAALILWPVSQFRQVEVWYGTAAGDGYFLGADSGRAGVEYASGRSLPRGWHVAADHPDWSHWSYLTWNTRDPDLAADLAAPTFLGVCWLSLPPGASSTFDGAMIPCSYLALLFAILPLLAFRLIRRRRKAARDTRLGLCPKCGYDLRAQHAGAGGALCPECGTPVAQRR